MWLTTQSARSLKSSIFSASRVPQSIIVRFSSATSTDSSRLSLKLCKSPSKTCREFLMASVISLCTCNLLPLRNQNTVSILVSRSVVQLRSWPLSHINIVDHCQVGWRSGTSPGKFVVLATTEGSTKSNKSDESIPSWAKPDSDEPPPWVRDERSGSNSQSNIEIPFYAYLLASTITAIAAIGSIFEYVNQKPVFGILNPDSVFYAPLLGFFVFTGIPTSGFLWFKSVEAANKEAEEQDRRDGYR